MNATKLLTAYSVLSNMLAKCVDDRRTPQDENMAQRDALALAVGLIDVELSLKLAQAGAGSPMEQYRDGLITLHEACNKIIEIATTLE